MNSKLYNAVGLWVLLSVVAIQTSLVVFQSVTLTFGLAFSTVAGILILQVYDDPDVDGTWSVTPNSG